MKEKDRVSQRRGIPLLRRLFWNARSSAQVEQAGDMRRAGWSLSEIAAEMHTTVENVRAMLMDWESAE